ncbi:MAG: c-type cytochrome [Candidatus Binatia bacterium]
MAALSLLLFLLLSTPLFAQPRGDAKNGRELYMEKCVLCHGSQGEGWDWTKKVPNPPMPVPDLAQVAPERSDQFLFDVVKGGGEAVGKTRFMPPFGFQLSDQEVWDLVAYMRSLSGKTK